MSPGPDEPLTESNPGPGIAAGALGRGTLLAQNVEQSEMARNGPREQFQRINKQFALLRPNRPIGAHIDSERRTLADI
jgi:hypothetical protein